MAVQVAAYAGSDWIVSGDEDVPMPKVDALAVAHIRPDGTDLHILDDEQRQNAWHRFQLLRSLRIVEEPSFRMEAVA